MKNHLILLFVALSGHLFAGSLFNIRDFGAKGDGKTVDTPAINATIDAAAQSGGGTVVFSSGTYLSYSIHLKSNITLQLEAGAVLLAASPTETDGYDPAEPNATDQYQDFGHSHWHNSLIWGENLENVTICGQGMINGTGLHRGDGHKLKDGIGNKAIALKLCKNVVLRNFKMWMGGHFALLATGVDNLTINNLTIDTNRDGMDIDCCRNVRISDCSVNSPWDDAIVLKASYGLGFFRDTENVTITNCFVSGYDKGTLLNGTYQNKDYETVPDKEPPTGRIKLGTESSGGFKNIAISNCVFQNCRGLALETVDGGALEDIVISNITMRDIFNSPIFLRLGARQRSPKNTPVGTLKRVSIDNVNVYNVDSRFACLITGLPDHCIEDVSISNLRIVYKGGGTAADAKAIVPENEKGYPEPAMFGTIPASAFYIRHVRNIKLSNVEVSFMQPDFRPSIILNDVKGTKLSSLEIPVYNKAKSVVLQNSDKPLIAK